jgi:hypothetical protein
MVELYRDEYSGVEFSGEVGYEWSGVEFLGKE